MGRSKRHHYLPRWILRGFAADNLLWQLDLRDGEGLEVSVGDAAVRKHHHRPDEPSAFPAAPEDMVTAIETPAATVGHSLRSGDVQITPSDRWKLAKFLGLALSRSPFSIRFRTDAHRDLARYFYSMKQQYPDLKFAGQNEIGIEHRMDDSGELIVTRDDELRDMFSTADLQARWMFLMTWTLLRAPTGSLIVPDIGYSQHDETVKPEPQALRSSDNAETVFPLSHDCALAVTPSEKSNWFATNVDDSWLTTTDGYAAMYFSDIPALDGREISMNEAHDLNLRAISQADHLVFAASEDVAATARSAANPEVVDRLKLRARNLIILEKDWNAEQKPGVMTMIESERVTTHPRKRVDGTTQEQQRRG